MESFDTEEDLARIHFDPDDWNNFSASEKIWFNNLKKTYEIVKSAGFNPKVPEFMMPQKSLEETKGIKPMTNMKQPNEKDEKDDEAGKEDENLPSCSNKERTRYNDLAQAEDASKLLHLDWENGLTKLPPKITKNVSVLLESEQKYLSCLDDLKGSENSEIATKETQFSPHAARTYPKRNVPKVCYAEASEIPSEDQLHGVNAVFKCDKCQALFANEDFLLRHRHNHRHEGHDRKHACPLCSYSAKALAVLKKHLLVHTGEKPHMCPFCERRFAQKSGLKMHLLIHSGKRPFECLDCGRRFRRANDLRHHEWMHSGFRPYVCATCRRQFRHSSNLRVHERIHTGQSPPTSVSAASTERRIDALC